MKRKIVRLLLILLFVVVGVTYLIEEFKSPKDLSETIKQPDSGDVQISDLKTKIWGPQRVSPGQKITYIIEYRNDGLKLSGEILLFVALDYSVKYISASQGAFCDSLNTVSWNLGNLPAKSNSYLNIQVEVGRNLLEGTTLETDAIINERPHSEEKRTYINIENMSSSTSHTVTTARNPNENLVYPEGSIRPGDRLDYTINYENEREDIACGVYITDTLDEDLDVSTLTINNNGTYDSNTRTIRWSIGEISPQQKCSVTFSVNVRQDAQNNAEIINFATVYFPSVPEITRTNGTVNRIVTVLPDTTPPVTTIRISYL